MASLAISNDMNILNFQSKKELNKYMKSISKDLGVKCSYCHDLNDKSIETPKKHIAREMIIMQNELNKQYFIHTKDSSFIVEKSMEISCWTCHRGKGHPDLIRPQ